MTIDGSVRSNLLSAISSAKRWRGRPVHKDTIGHWQSVLEHGQRASTGPLPEPVGELVAELELELNQARACKANQQVPHVTIEGADDYRARAAQARRISVNMHNRKAQIELRDMADALDAEAERLERVEKPEPTLPRTNDV